MHLRLKWNDPRLRFTSNGSTERLIAPDGYWNHIWTPDLFFRNVIQTYSYDDTGRPNILMTIRGNGDVWYVKT